MLTLKGRHIFMYGNERNYDGSSGTYVRFYSITGSHLSYPDAIYGPMDWEHFTPSSIRDELYAKVSDDWECLFCGRQRRFEKEHRQSEKA